MNKLYYTILFFLLGLCFISAQNNFDDSITIINRNLDKIESLYLQYLSGDEKQEAVTLANEIREILNGNSYLTSLNNNYNILSEEGFVLLYQNVENEITDFRKTETLVEFLASGKIFCRHLEKLILLYSSDLTKEKMIQAISDNILDPVNIGIVLQHINSTIIRDNLIEYFSK